MNNDLNSELERLYQIFNKVSTDQELLQHELYALENRVKQLESEAYTKEFFRDENITATVS